MKTIPLTQGQFAMVDDEDFYELSKFKWFAHKQGRTFYAHRNGYSNGKRIIIRMHSLLTGFKLTDHIDGNGLNNQKSNLRNSTFSGNAENRRIRITNSTGYKGVSWCKISKKWHARITSNGKTQSLGKFECKINAAEAYNAAALRLHGKFSKLNVIS